MLIDQSGAAESRCSRWASKKASRPTGWFWCRGPDEEVKIVRWIYQTFIDEGKSESEIAKSLNAQGVVTDFGRAWNRATVHQVLTNEKYIGNNVYHRTSFKLKRKHVENPPDKWIRADGVFEGIVEPEPFSHGAGNHSGAQPETYR